jgi:cell surface protein SprA
VKPKPLPLKNPKDSGYKAIPDTVKKDNILKPVFELLGKALISFKTASFTYAETNGTMLPGFRPKSQLIGEDLNNKMAPGIGFISGSQHDIRPEAVNNNWLVKNPYLSSLYTTTATKNLNLRASIEPVQSLRIELTATRSKSENHSENYMFDKDAFRSFNPQDMGNFSMSYNTFATAFFSDDKNYASSTFQQFRNNRYEIAERLAAERQASTHVNAGHSLTTGFANGYGPSSQEVLIPAFLAAYGGGTVKTVGLETFPTIPKPNWRITYDGLSKYEWAKKYFTSVSLGHSYRSTYSIPAFNTDLKYIEGGSQLNRDLNYISRYNITQISISEQFGPLISVDLTWKNSLSTRMEIKKDRSIAMSFAGNQLTEIKGNEYVIGAGYRLKQFNLPFKVFGNSIKLKNDLNFRADLSVRSNTTVIRKVIENVETASAGSIIISIKISIDYIVNERFSIRLFYDRIMTNPVVSSSFPTANTNFGISVRFTLAQ